MYSFCSFCCVFFVIYFCLFFFFFFSSRRRHTRFDCDWSSDVCSSDLAAIELTRFPVPADEDHQETGNEAGLMRAADLIGQLADPNYLRKQTALFHEFVETGMAQKLGFTSPADLGDNYVRFFWEKVEPYIGDALRYLALTQEGRQWIANLYAQVFTVEHRRWRMGPHSGV